MGGKEMAIRPKRLSDLYVVGKEVVFDDGDNDPVKVWLQKISPLDHETALRQANLLRSRVLARHESTSTDYDLAHLEAEELGRDGQIEYLVMDGVSKKIPSFEAETAYEEPWGKDGYLQGLRDAWAEGMEARYIENSEDEEAAHVFNEIKKYTEQVEKLIEDEREDLRRRIEGRDPDKVLDQVTERFLSSRADVAWLTEFRKSEIWLAVREPDDHHKRYFQDRTEVDELSQEVLVRLLTEYRMLTVDPSEGKDSAAPDSSSESSESPEKLETEESSGPVAVNE